jgi:hypothetical protein
MTGTERATIELKKQKISIYYEDMIKKLLIIGAREMVAISAPPWEV